VAWVREAAGNRFEDLELGCLVYRVVVSDDSQQLSQVRATGASAPITGLQILQGIYVLTGTVDQICEQVIANREHYGISYITVFEQDMEAFAPVVERLSGK